MEDDTTITEENNITSSKKRSIRTKKNDVDVKEKKPTRTKKSDTTLAKSKDVVINEESTTKKRSTRKKKEEVDTEEKKTTRVRKTDSKSVKKKDDVIKDEPVTKKRTTRVKKDDAVKEEKKTTRAKRIGDETKEKKTIRTKKTDTVLEEKISEELKEELKTKKRTTRVKKEEVEAKEETTKTRKKSTNKKEDTNVTETATEVKKTRTSVRSSYYLFQMNTYLLNGLSLLLIILGCLLFYLLYGDKSLGVLSENLNIVIVLYLPYLILHELLHSLGYVIYGADFNNITYGAHLEKGILCCLCKQNIDKRNILHSLLYPFILIGILTLVIGIIFNYPILIILSLANISGCSGDLIMFYHLSKLNDYQFSEYNDPIAFALYTKNDFSNLKMFGLDYVEKKTRLERNDLRKVVVSKTSIIILVVFYLLMIFTMVA